jgi:hypothetical protein
MALWKNHMMMDFEPMLARMKKAAIHGARGLGQYAASELALGALAGMSDRSICKKYFT